MIIVNKANWNKHLKIWWHINMIVVMLMLTRWWLLFIPSSCNLQTQSSVSSACSIQPLYYKPDCMFSARKKERKGVRENSLRYLTIVEIQMLVIVRICCSHNRARASKMHQKWKNEYLYISHSCSMSIHKIETVTRLKFI